MAVQWVHLDAGEVLVASERGAWVQPPTLGAPALARPMPDALAATPESMAHLLDGVIAAAESGVPRTPGSPISPYRWAWYLVGQWYCAQHSIELLATVIERFGAGGRGDLAGFATQKYDEEQGHDRFPLDDLRALGFDAEAVVQAVEPDSGPIELIDYARGCVQGENPVEFLGYIFALERQMLRLSPQWFNELDAAFAPAAAPASFLRIHATDLDVAHVSDGTAYFAGLPATDRTAIALGCYRTTQIRHSQHSNRYPPEGELEDRLSPFRAVRVGAGGPCDPRPEGEQP